MSHEGKQEPKRLHVITNSELETWRKCRALWGFKYAEGIRPVREVESVSFGKLYHGGAAAGWVAAWQEAEVSIAGKVERAVTAARAAIVAAARAASESLLGEPGKLSEEELDEQIAELEEHREIGLWAVGNYFEQCSADLRMVPLAIEFPFRVPIPNAAGKPGILLQEGVIDLVLWDRDAGLVVVQDHKTTGYTVEALAKRLPLDTQMSGYVRAINTLLGGRLPLAALAALAVRENQAPPAALNLAAQDPVGLAAAGLGPLVFNVVRRARPAQPKINLLRMTKGQAAVNTPLAALFRLQEEDGVPRGEVSVQGIDTTAEVYGDALLTQQVERYQEITEKQRALLEHLCARPSTYLAQLEFYRGPSELERWRVEQWVEAKQLRAAERDPRLRTRNPHACASPQSPPCVYAAVCQAPDSPEARAEFRAAASRHEEIREAHDGATRHGESTGGGDGGIKRTGTQISPAEFRF